MSADNPLALEICTNQFSMATTQSISVQSVTDTDQIVTTQSGTTGYPIHSFAHSKKRGRGRPRGSKNKQGTERGRGKETEVSRANRGRGRGRGKTRTIVNDTKGEGIVNKLFLLYILLEDRTQNRHQIGH